MLKNVVLELIPRMNIDALTYYEIFLFGKIPQRTSKSIVC